MPNTGMLDHDALQRSHPLASPTWMPAWPAKSFGYRLQSARPRRHTIQVGVNVGSGRTGFSRHMATETAGVGAKSTTRAADSPPDQRRRPYSAPAEMMLAVSRSGAAAPKTPFTTRLLSINDDDEEKTDLSSALWTSAAGQRHLRGGNDITPFHTMQKVTCGAYFSRHTDHRMVNFGVLPVNTPRWRSEGKH